MDASRKVKNENEKKSFLADLVSKMNVSMTRIHRVSQKYTILPQILNVINHKSGAEIGL